MKLNEFFKNIDTWKIIIMIGIFAAIFLAWFGFSIITPWGTITKESYEKVVSHNLVKIKTQSNYARDMKERMLNDLGSLYEEKLILYCAENNIIINQNQVISDVKYYRTIVMAMNDVCEEITLNRYIYDNDLYRYTNENDWKSFKLYVVDLFIKEGKKVLINNYDNSKVVMPVQCWVKLAGKDLAQSLRINTEQLLDGLRVESVLYHNMKK